MEFKELVKTRRSCRSFETSDVSEEQISSILDAGQWAPSPLNLQPWEYVIVTDKKIQGQIIKAAEDAKQTVIDSDGPGWVNKYGMNFLDEAPVYIVVVFDPSKGGLGGFFSQPHGALQAVSACVQNMMLAAADLGLGSLWFTFFAPDKVKTILDIPEKLEIAGVIPIGKHREEIKAPPRKEPKVHKERYTR
ncbi:MAG: nitroreductase family protein [Desulfobacterales bacterium]|nr:MAG: nitroreductase family protein [Desulfobacterales bacterium]